MTFFSVSASPALDRAVVTKAAVARTIPPPDYPRWPTFIDGHLEGCIPWCSVLMGRHPDTGAGLERREVKFLGAMLAKLKIPPADVAWVHDWDEVRAGGVGYVLSVGEQGLKAWHDFGVVKVNMHGDVFRHVDAQGDEFCVMPIQHPAAVFQQTAWGYGVKGEIERDLHVWHGILLGVVDPEHVRPKWCAKCLGARRKKGQDPIRRQATHWFDAVDGIGLCDDHWKRRAEITHVPRSRPKPGTPEAQIPGQLALT